MQTQTQEEWSASIKLAAENQMKILRNTGTPIKTDKFTEALFRMAFSAGVDWAIEESLRHIEKDIRDDGSIHDDAKAIT